MFRTPQDALDYLAVLGQDFLRSLPEAAGVATQFHAQTAINTIRASLERIPELEKNQRRPRPPKPAAEPTPEHPTP